MAGLEKERTAFMLNMSRKPAQMNQNQSQSQPAVQSTSMNQPLKTDPPGILRGDPGLPQDAAHQPRRWNTDIPHILPHEKVFPIQIGNQLFRLSGASISSDGQFCLLALSCSL